MGQGLDTGALCPPRPTAQSHLSATTITVTSLAGGCLEVPGQALGSSSTGSTLPRPSGQQRPAFHRGDTHSLPLPHSQLGDRKRQAPNAKQPRRLGRRPFPPLLFLPQRQRNGCHFETSGLCPRGQAPRDSQQMSE